MHSTKVLGFALLSVLALAAPVHEEEGLSIGNVERSVEPLDAVAMLEKRLAALDSSADLYAREAYGGMQVSSAGLNLADVY